MTSGRVTNGRPKELSIAHRSPLGTRHVLLGAQHLPFCAGTRGRRMLLMTRRFAPWLALVTAACLESAPLRSTDHLPPVDVGLRRRVLFRAVGEITGRVR